MTAVPIRPAVFPTQKFDAPGQLCYTNLRYSNRHIQ